jgi:Protein of Unknown function (DUF2784)
MKFWYHLLDYFFLYFHFAVVLFNLFGWIWSKTRKWNLALLLLTGASWFILGIFYGIGYCPLTAWHWTVLYKLGVTNLPNSYIKYIVFRIFGVNFRDGLVDSYTGISFSIAFTCSVIFNFLDYRRMKHVGHIGK